MFDVIVIGGGHAGVEAATASARIGAKTLLVTLNMNDIGQMSCNPAIGGIGKGHIVKEIDALDGLMAKIIDNSGIQFRVLNQSKGPAVQGPRAQADRELYKQYSQKILKEYDNLQIKIAHVNNIVLKKDSIHAIVLNNQEQILTKSVVITTGTFLNGLIHIGSKTIKAGRYNSPSSTGLADFLINSGLKTDRLKTGTPARLKKDSIDWEKLEIQTGDNPPKPFSYETKSITIPQINCYITHTNQKAHDIIANNLDKSAIYNGSITTKGPRYCPSIEDKIVRFNTKSHHQIFLEPEGLNSDLIYPNGLSTALPENIQLDFLQSIVGLEKVKVHQFGYSIEYDYVNPLQLKHTLEVKKFNNLFLAGQINGTTGYEEAAGQGLVAGANAAIKALEISKEFVISRYEGYIGVMIDDLVTQGVTEPYRMFTSRAEYRMMLRADNADLRLTKKGHNFGLIKNIARYNNYLTKTNSILQTKTYLNSLKTTPSQIQKKGIKINQDGIIKSALSLLSYNHLTKDDLIKIWPDLHIINDDILSIIQTECIYSKYISKQTSEIKILEGEDQIKLSDDIDYSSIEGLSAELSEKLNQIKPESLRIALRTQGATPASGIAIFSHIKKRELHKNKINTHS